MSLESTTEVIIRRIDRDEKPFTTAAGIIGAICQLMSRRMGDRATARFLRELAEDIDPQAIPANGPDHSLTDL